ncbi:MAG TPA: DEAD/DEAH box helicase [Acidimicrobiales bacterium]|nr:DEAD/DEAH box helicase [Acidimicrobiales bacterium]
MSTTNLRPVGVTSGATQVPSEYTALVQQLAALPAMSEQRRDMVEAAVGVWRRPGFDTFASVSNLPFEPFEHQLHAAAVVLQRMSGRAILADEVGLGKTIEAGIVLSELRLRGLARRVLVLAPTGLVDQWGEEFERKFAIPTVVATSERWTPAEMASTSIDDPVILASLATARRLPLRDLLTEVDWDLVVVDEAHRVRNPRTASSKLVRALRVRFMLLLTATPVENRIDDLYHLVSLVRPGHLGTITDFRRRHGASSDRQGEVGQRATEGTPSVAALGELRRSMRDVMVRHRRSEVALMLPRRLAETLSVQPSAAEAALYRQIAERVRIEGRQSGPGRSMALRTVLRLAGSSPKTVAATLDRLGWSDLAEVARSVSTCAKTSALGALVQRHVASGEKVIIFTSFRETMAQLVATVELLGLPQAVYHGSLDRRAKDSAIASFENEVDVLVSTESAGEGRNLQFCHAMINFDLPWNPMQIEQRLGRIHRIGQTHDVVLTNLVSRGTIEDRILDVLHSKLNLFELVVGELDMVLGRIGEEFMFEDAVFEAHVMSVDDAELIDRLEKLGSTLVEARAGYADSRGWTDDLVAEMGGGPMASSDAMKVR